MDGWNTIRFLLGRLGLFFLSLSVLGVRVIDLQDPHD